MLDSIMGLPGKRLSKYSTACFSHQLSAYSRATLSQTQWDISEQFNNLQVTSTDAGRFTSSFPTVHFGWSTNGSSTLAPPQAPSVLPRLPLEFQEQLLAFAKLKRPPGRAT